MRTPPTTATRRKLCSMHHSLGCTPAPQPARVAPAGAAHPRRLFRRAAVQHLDVGLALVLAKMQRTAPVWGKARRKNDAGVDQVGAGDDPLIERLLRLCDQRLDELAAKALHVEAVIGRWRLALLRLAILPDVKALARLPPELAGRNHVIESAAA